MKMIKRSIIILIVLLLSITAVYVFFGGVLGTAYSYLISESRIEHKDIKQIDLSSLEKIIITVDGKETVLDKEQSDFNNIKNIFDKKRVKIDSSNFHNWSDEFPKIEFITVQNSYTLYLDNSTVNDSKVYFVLNDYSNPDTNELLYQGVKISKSDFNEIFEITQGDGSFVYNFLM